MPTYMVKTMEDMRGAYMKFCSDKICARQSDAVHLANLEALDFGALQILCTMDALSKVRDVGDGVSSSNNEDSIIKDT